MSKTCLLYTSLVSAKTLKSEVAAAAVATSGCGPEGVEVVEGAEVELSLIHI